MVAVFTPASSAETLAIGPTRTIVKVAGDAVVVGDVMRRHDTRHVA